MIVFFSNPTHKFLIFPVYYHTISENFNNSLGFRWQVSTNRRWNTEVRWLFSEVTPSTITMMMRRWIPMVLLKKLRKRKINPARRNGAKKNTRRQFVRKKLQRKQFAIARKKLRRRQFARKKSRQYHIFYICLCWLSQVYFCSWNIGAYVVVANTGDRGQIQSSQERIKAPAYGADVSQERVALQGGESSQERNATL